MFFHCQCIVNSSSKIPSSLCFALLYINVALFIVFLISNISINNISMWFSKFSFDKEIACTWLFSCPNILIMTTFFVSILCWLLGIGNSMSPYPRLEKNFFVRFINLLWIGFFWIQVSNVISVKAFIVYWLKLLLNFLKHQPVASMKLLLTDCKRKYYYLASPLSSSIIEPKPSTSHIWVLDKIALWKFIKVLSISK